MLAVVVMVSLFWILPRVARLRREPDYSGKVGFFGFCLVLLALACLFLMSAYVLQVRSVLVSRSEGRSSWVASSRGSASRYLTGPLRAQTARRAASSPSAPAIVQSEDRPLSIRAYWFPNQNVINVVGAIADIILCAALVGGILGGLFRSRKGEEISRDTFLRDSVRHFEPLAAVYLLFWSLTGFLPMLLFLRTAPWPKWCLPILGMLSILSILLMYAPFGVVTQGLGLAGAIRHSLRVWKSTLWGTTRLIAVGSLFFVLSRALNYALPEIVVRTSWLAILRSPIHALISVAAQALITLAVWEFYSANVLQPEDALEERG